MTYGSRIIGTGAAHPETVMTNQDFTHFLETSDEWIRTRTGIHTRRISDPKKGENTLSLAILCAKRAIERAGITAADIDMIVCGTVTPDSMMPTTANSVQAALGANKAFSFDLQAACSGFLYGFSIADQYIKSGAIKYALVIGVETLSTVMDWRDRSTCVLFGDAGGAVVLERSEDPEHRILATKLYSDGRLGELLCIPHGGSRVPPYSAEYRLDQHKVKMKGAELFKHAVRNMAEASTSILAENNLKASDVDFFLFHQANLRIIDYCAKTLGVHESKTWINLDRYGNTSSATLPVCLDEAWKAGKIKSGDLVLMATFGGGLTWASSLVKL